MIATAPTHTITLDEHHVYRVDGRVCPGVTHVLQDVGVIDFSHVPLANLVEGQDRGRRVHAACHYLAQGELEWNSLEESERGYVTAASRFLADHGFQHALAVEKRVYHPRYRYCGTLDLCARLKGRPTLIDWKTGSPHEVGAELQTAAYDNAFRAETLDETPMLRYAVRLRRDGRYSIEAYDDAKDFRVFLAALTISNYKRQHQHQ